MNVVAKEYPAAAMMTSAQQNIEAGNSSDKRQPALNIFSVWCGFIDGRAPENKIPKSGVFQGCSGFHLPAFSFLEIVFTNGTVTIGFGANPLSANALNYPYETDNRKYIETIADDFLNNEIKTKGLGWISKNNKDLLKIDMAKHMQVDMTTRIGNVIKALDEKYPGKRAAGHDQNSPSIEFRGIEIPLTMNYAEAGKIILANVLEALTVHKAILPSQKEMAYDYLMQALSAQPERPATNNKAQFPSGNPFLAG